MKTEATQLVRAVASALLLGAIGVVGCTSKVAETPTETTTNVDDQIEKVSEQGPVKATVTVTPKEPRLGDSLVLTLQVEAAAGVTVEMPAFGEALGRFSILDFTPRMETGADGTQVLSQRYTLQPPMSGRQRLPPLRLEFVDGRDPQTTDADEIHELLTEEVPLVVASVLPEGAVADELRPARGALKVIRPSAFGRTLKWLVAAAGIVLAALGWRWWRQHALERARISAYDKAIARFAKLEQRGFPGAAEADAWYVELSGIIRRYLEDRYRVRAPELTTEEFLREARRSAELTVAHRELLGSFLERCDRVKFAAYVPAADESREVLTAARRFLDETRLKPEELQAQRGKAA